jgi:hypothetical protein
MQTQNALLLSVKEYRHNAAVVGRAHFMAWERNSLRNRLFGGTVVAITAVVGTAIFGTIQQDPDLHWRILAGTISIAATVLAALQTYLNFAERAEKHQEAGSGYAKIRRQFDLLAIEMSQKGGEYNAQAMTELKRIVSDLNELSEKSPSIADKIYDAARVQAEAAASPSDLEFRSARSRDNSALA